MSQLIALEWDEQEIRIAVAASRRRKCVINHAFTVPLDSGGHSEQSIGEQIGAALAARRIERPEAIVVVGRANIELQRMTLPPVPDDELPDIVRYEAGQRFTTLGEDWPIDFFPVSEDPEQERDVIAASINPTVIEQILATCQIAGIRPVRLVLRPCAAASFLTSRDRRVDDDTVQLMIDPLVNEADLTVVVDQRVVFMRTVRLPSANAPQAQTEMLIAEVRRTMAAVQNQLGGRRVEAAIVCGTDRENVDLRNRLSELLELTVSSLDPFKLVETPSAASNYNTDAPGRFTPLLGVLRDETGGQLHAIDFLNPRRRPEQTSRMRMMVLAGAACVAVLLFAGVMIYLNLASLDKKLVQLNSRYERLDLESKPAKKTIERARTLQLWQDYDACWIEELCELSRDFPPPEEIDLIRLRVDAAKPPRQTAGRKKTADQGEPDGGSILLDIYMYDLDAIKLFGERLADTYRIPQSANPSQEEVDGRTAWRLSETITVKQKKEPVKKGKPQSSPANENKGGASS